MSLFNIHIASQLSGVASATIRAWEKRYQAIRPQRAENGHRLYSDDDIAKLALLRKLTSQGHAIGTIAALSMAELENIIPEEDVAPLLDMNQLRAGLFFALAAYKLDVISHELDKLKKALSPRDFALEFIAPLFREIGLRTAKGTLTVAQEHSLSAIAQFHMGQMIAQHYFQITSTEKLVFIVAPEGELHGIGLLASCLLCIEYKIPFLFLGENMSAAALRETVEQLKPTTIIMGVVNGHQLTEKLTLQQYLQELRVGLHHEVDIRIGGNIKPWVMMELEKIKVGYLPTLESLDLFLSNYSQAYAVAKT